MITNPGRVTIPETGNTHAPLVMEVVCAKCGKVEKVSVTYAQFLELSSPDRRNIQKILPNASADVREMFMSGYCGECYDRMFP